MTYRPASVVFALLLMTLPGSLAVAQVCSDDTFMTQRSTITDLALDDTYVYASLLNGIIVRASKSTAVSTTLFTASSRVEQLIVDSTKIYFTVPGFTTADRWNVYSMPKDGSAAPTLLFESPESITALVGDSTHLYWIVPPTAETASDGKVQRLPKGGGTAQTLVSSLARPFDLAVGENDIFVTESGVGGLAPFGLQRAPKGGGPATRLDGSKPGRHILTVDAQNVRYSVLEVQDFDRIYRVPVGGGTPVAESVNLFDSSQLATNGTRTIQSVGRFDWTNSTSGYVRVIESNGTQTTLFTSPVRDFVSDSAAIYALTGISTGGRIERLCLNFASAPHINSIDANASPAGGTKIGINGLRFQTGARVVFDGLEGPEGVVTSVTATRVEVIAPPHNPGTVEIYVINPNGEAGRGQLYYDPTLGTKPARRRAVEKS